MLHELHQPFNTPTINLYITAPDFLKFVKNLEYYLSLEPVEDKSQIEIPFPVGVIDDVHIYFMHYQTFESAKEKWETRKRRVNLDNIYIIMAQSSELCTDAIVEEFDQLPYKNKVIFTAKDYPSIKSAYHIPGSETKNNCIRDLCSYKSKFSGRRWLDDYDYVSFFNNVFSNTKIMK